MATIFSPIPLGFCNVSITPHIEKQGLLSQPLNFSWSETWLDQQNSTEIVMKDF